MARTLVINDMRRVVLVAFMLAVAFTAGWAISVSGNNHGPAYHACLYAGSLSQVGTTEPANCGRGQQVSWNAEGPAGTDGAPGQDGVLGYTIERLNGFIEPSTTSVVTAVCKGGQKVLGGGFLSETLQLRTVASYPGDAGLTWNARVRNDNSTTIFPYSVYAICADVQ